MTDTAQTRPWNEAISFYEGLASARGRAYEPMAEMVRFIASSRYAGGMFASIDGEALCIGKTPNFTVGSGELRIGFDEAGQVFTFVHAQRPEEKFPWTLTCAAGEWESVFERLVHKRLRWFHEG